MAIKRRKKDDRFECIRWIQSIIEVMGNVIGDDKVDVMAQWIGDEIEKWIDVTDTVGLLELLYPYLQLRINSSENSTKHRYICIVLSHLIMFSKEYDSYFIAHIRSEVFTYLTRVCTETSDEWTQMFALIALENLELHSANSGNNELDDDLSDAESSEDNFSINIQLKNSIEHFIEFETSNASNETRFLQNNQHFLNTINKLKNDKRIKNVYKSLVSRRCSPLSYQHRFTSEHFVDHVLEASQSIHKHNPASASAALDCSDRTKHLKLSSDMWSARSDWRLQSVRSVCYVKKRICYFEIVLLTNGPMRIGWSTKRTKLGRTEVGGDMFSIGFDGYSRCVWHNDDELRLKTKIERWKAHDVVGCIIEVIKNAKDGNDKKFTFYLNGQQISYQSESRIYSSPHPYYASVSLSSHQQVWFNFGQIDFRYPPEEKDYLSLYHYSLEYPSHKSSSVNMRNSTFTNTFASFDSNNIMGNVSMSYQNVTIDNILKKGLTFECITCPKCGKEILLKNFFLDCCACLKLSMTRSTGKELSPITSTEHTAQNSSQMVSDSLASSSGPMPINQGIACKLCDEIKQTRPLQFVGCDHMKLCRDCLPDVFDCPKCKANRNK